MLKKQSFFLLFVWATNKVKQIISGRHDVYIVLLYQLFFARKKEKIAIKMSSKYLVESRIASWEILERLSTIHMDK